MPSKRRSESLEALLAPVPALTEAAARSHVRRARNKRKGELVTVYRTQLVEERKILVPKRSLGLAGAVELAFRYLDAPDREHFIVMLCDAGNEILGVHTAAVGCIGEVHVSMRSVYKAALLRNAEAVVVAHNHVCGSTKPSIADKRLTKSLQAAGDTLRIELLDHLILGRTRRDWFSFRAAGLL